MSSHPQSSIIIMIVIVNAQTALPLPTTDHLLCEEYTEILMVTQYHRILSSSNISQLLEFIIAYTEVHSSHHLHTE